MMFKSAIGQGVNCIPYSTVAWIKSVPGIARLQRWLITGFLSNRSCKRPRFKVSLPLDKAVWTGIYEPEFIAALVEQTKPGDICYDIDGYRGYVSGAMALTGASKVFALEPLPDNRTSGAQI